MMIIFYEKHSLCCLICPLRRSEFLAFIFDYFLYIICILYDDPILKHTLCCFICPLRRSELLVLPIHFIYALFTLLLS